MADNLEFELHVASDEHWENYKKTHGKQYHPDEEKERYLHGMILFERKQNALSSNLVL